MPKGGFRVWAAHAQVLQVRASGDLQQSSCRGEADIQEQAVWGNWHLPYCHFYPTPTEAPSFKCSLKKMFGGWSHCVLEAPQILRTGLWSTGLEDPGSQRSADKVQTAMCVRLGSGKLGTWNRAVVVRGWVTGAGYLGVPDNCLI